MCFERPECQKLKVNNGTQSPFTCSKGAMETSEQYVKFVKVKVKVNKTV